ncbi:MAG: hypothetical protein KAX39_04820 [candidate division Zixibacteria bacterium]|nr:hypothetical protein [candidate division Zixibacteria bacterium]
MRIERLPEPELLAKGPPATFCKTALLDGPYSALQQTHKEQITVGIVGLKSLVEKTKDWIDLCNDFVESRASKSKGNGGGGAINKDLFPDFPGTPIAFQCKIVTDDSYIQPIILSECRGLDKRRKFKYIEELLSIFESKIKSLLDINEKKPDVILCILSDEMYETCHVVGDYHKKIKKRKLVDRFQLNLFQDFDSFQETGVYAEESKPFFRNFRSALKKIVMNPQIGVPVQIVREHTIDPDDITTQNAATKAWNFCTGVFYKSGHLPWVLRDLDGATCFMGISFYHKKSHYADDVFTSMAHLFSNDFEGLILKGDKVDFDEALRSPRLDYDKAQRLLKRSLSEYIKIRGTKPKRLVIHKTSLFNEEEIKGFSEVLEQAHIAYDLVTSAKASLKLVRHGKYPVPRGTFISLDENTYFLYTKGYVPELRTYPGVHIPAPFRVIRWRGDSSVKEVCKEISALTKLNWNTADFCCGLPITIGFAKNVGQILREFDENDPFEPQRSYRFYM